MKALNFSKMYKKLYFHEFTTVRGKTAFNKYDIGETVYVTVKKEIKFQATLIDKQIIVLDDLGLEDMQKDADTYETQIQSKQEFVDLINSFNPSYYTQATLKSEKTIFYFKKSIGSML